MTPSTSIYIHIPFCTHRCAYCDFNTYAGQESLIPAYVDALIREIEFVGQQTTEPFNYQTTAHTVFFGGGTPSLLSSKQFEKILRALRENFNLLEDSENTIEANPGTVSLEELQQLRKIGINRISFGVQSANTEELRMLERAHNFFDVIEAVASARKAGFDNLNLDLIYGLPEQSIQTWQRTVHRILDLHPEHISAYALTLEHGAPFGRWSSRGLLPLSDPDLAAEMYEWAGNCFEANGFIQYEISNWAKDLPGKNLTPDTWNLEPGTWNLRAPHFACKHNLQYWHSLPYLAFGAGAHGYAYGYRYSNVLQIKTYIERLSQSSAFRLLPIPLTPATVNHHKQTEHDEMPEFMITGLRLTNAGVTEADFKSRFGRGLCDVYQKEIEELISAGLLEREKTSGSIDNSEVLRLTKRGRLLGNQVFLRFV